MKPAIHAAAGVVAMLTVLTFWMSTAISELFFSQEAIAVVKQAILYGMLVLIPAMAITGASGFSLGGKRKGRLVDDKKWRMRIIALNGLLVMLPSAFFLDGKASVGELDGPFYVVQPIELSVGLAQLFLMGKNFRDGLRLAGRLRSLRLAHRGSDHDVQPS